MQNVLTKQTIDLKLPAQRSMMLVLRLTTAGVVARIGLGVDRMDDVKMAVEEACNCLISDESAQEQLCLSFSVADQQLCVRICADEGCHAPVAEEDELGIVRCILESLVDDVQMRIRDGELRAVELRVALNM